ncbi:hypothetical protein CLOM_g19326 [Closterium sp. NIES-68]|nr:hypothetical protein CLOM_g19326 [Closterium sp. NIES-68]GJP58950.1 hypothetical protein CLOP_g6718 [Closterium sp. NIES-67]
MAASDVATPSPVHSAGDLQQNATSATTATASATAEPAGTGSAVPHLLALVQDMRATRDSLGDRPSVKDVEAAAKEIIAIDKHLVSQMEALVSETRPDGADAYLFQQLVALKRDVMQTAAIMKKRKPQAILDLEAKYRHYDKMVMLAEEAVLTGRLPTLVASAGTEPVAAEPCAEPAEAGILPDAVISEETDGEKAVEAVTDGANVGDANDGDAAATAAAAAAAATPAVAAAVAATTAAVVGAAAAGAAIAASPPAETAAAKPVTVTSATSPDSTLAATAAESPAATAIGSPATQMAVSRPAPTSFSPPPAPSARAASFGRDVGGAAEIRRDAGAGGKGGKDGKGSHSNAVSKFATMPQQASQLKPIEEASSDLEIDPKLLSVLEEAAQDRRQELDLQGHHFKAPLAYVPESIGLLDWIVELRLANNGLVVLPQAIGNLFCLSVLDASCNKLVELPESIGHLAKLRVLDLHHNYLEELPTSIGHCEALEELRLGFNSLTGLPEAICKLGELKLLSAPLNQLTYVPRRIGNLEKLTDLDVHYNSLQSIPESIGRLERLTVLNISANHYHLKELPETIGNLRSLVKLDISENYIKILPISFVNLTSLKKLSLQGNPWQHPPMDVANSGLQGVMDYLNLQDITEGEGHGGSKKLGGLLGFFRQKQKEDPKLAAWKKNTRTL